MRWSHGHSIGAGVLGGLLVSRRPELVFAAGVATTVAAFEFRRLAAGASRGVSLLHGAKVRSELARARKLRAEAKVADDRREVRERRERAAYLRGHADGSR